MSTTPNFDGQVPRDADGFWAYGHGGIVNAKFATFAYSEGTATKFTIPANAEIVGWITNVDTAFVADSANTIDIGISGTATKFGTGISVASATQVLTGYVASQMFTPTTEDQAVVIAYKGVNGSAGSMTLACLYIMR